MIVLHLDRIVVACRRIEREAIERFGFEAHLEHIGFEIQEIARLVVIPPPVGEELAVIVHRHTANAVGVELLVVTGRLDIYADRAGIERHSAIGNQRARSGIEPEGAAIFVEQAATCRKASTKRHVEFGRTAPAIFGAGDRLDLTFEPVGLRFLGDVVEQAARCAGAIEHSARSLQEFDPLHVEQLRDGKSGIGVAAQPVIEDFLLPEAARRHSGVGEETHAGDVPIEILCIPRALILDQLLRDRRDDEAGFERRGVELSRAGLFHPVQLLRAPGDDDGIRFVMGKGAHTVLRAWGRLILFDLLRRIRRMKLGRCGCTDLRP